MTVWTAENTVKLGRKCRVFFNGEEIKDVSKADDLVGYVEQQERDAKGNLCLMGGEISTVMLFGKVEVVLDGA